MESLAPNVFVKSIDNTMEFYKKLGFEVEMSVPENGSLVWVMMTCGNVKFMFQSFESLGEHLPEISREDGGSLLFYIQVKEIRKFRKKIKEDVNVIKDLEKTFYGATEFSILDNNGYILTFAENEEQSILE